MKKAIITLGAAALIVAGAATPSAADTNLWLHVKVQENDDTRVTVNLPMSVVGKALPMLPKEHFSAEHMRIEEMDMSVAEMRELWQEMQNTPDVTFVTIEEGDDNVKVWKEAGYLMVSVVENGDEKVEVRVPARVVDALLSGEGDELDLVAALEALVDEGEGQLVTVTGDDENVRVWVDRIAEAD